MAARQRSTLTLRIVVIALLCVAVGWPTIPGGQPQAMTAQTLIRTTCATDEQPYPVDVCLTAPDAGFPIEEDILIQATVTVKQRGIDVLSLDFELDKRCLLYTSDAADE